MFKQWFESTEYVANLNSVSQLMSQWFVGGFMHGKRLEDVPQLFEGFKLLAQLSPPTSPMTLYRAMPQKRSLGETIGGKISIELHNISSWCKTDAHARSFYYEISKDKSSPVKHKPHVIVKSEFSPNEIMFVVNDVMQKLDELLESLKDNPDFPYRLANVWHNMKWHEGQQEVIVHAPGERRVTLIERL